MKYLLTALLVGAGALFALSGCSKGNLTTPSCNVPNAGALTYTANVKPIVDKSCISCHGANRTAPGDFRTYEGIKPYLSSGTFSDLVVVRQSMPPAGSLPQTEIDSINCWIQAGFAK